MTLVDLAHVAAFWLLLMVLRLPLRVDPAYRGKRRHGVDRPPWRRPEPVVPELLTLKPHLLQVPPTHVPTLDDDRTELLALEETGPLYVSMWKSNGSKYVEPERMGGQR